MNTNFKDLGLTRLGIEPKASTPEADALSKTQSYQKCIFAKAFIVSSEHEAFVQLMLDCPTFFDKWELGQLPNLKWDQYPKA